VPLSLNASPANFGVRRQSEAATALWLSQIMRKSKAVSRCACHPHSIKLAAARVGFEDHDLIVNRVV